MKIAFVSDEGENISAHFGRAAYYQVVEVDAGREVGRELRDKMGHSHFQASNGHEEESNQPHGFSPESQSRHTSMLAAIEDCAVVICGGMGQGALMSIQAAGKEVLLTDVGSIDEALTKYLAGDLSNHANLAH